VSIGVLATALWLIGRDATLATLATPKEDHGALELDVRQAQSLGKERARATAQAKLKRASRLQGQQDEAARGRAPNKPTVARTKLLP
jgi:hypothetical protein